MSLRLYSALRVPGGLRNAGPRPTCLHHRAVAGVVRTSAAISAVSRKSVAAGLVVMGAYLFGLCWPVVGFYGQK